MFGETALAGGTRRTPADPMETPLRLVAGEGRAMARCDSATGLCAVLPLRCSPALSRQPRVVEIPVSAATMHLQNAARRSCQAMPRVAGANALAETGSGTDTRTGTDTGAGAETWQVRYGSAHEHAQTQVQHALRGVQKNNLVGTVQMLV